VEILTLSHKICKGFVLGETFWMHLHDLFLEMIRNEYILRMMTNVYLRASLKIEESEKEAIKRVGNT